MDSNLSPERLAFLQRAQSMIGKGELPAVREAARGVVAGDPDFLEARFLLAFVASRMGDWEEAEAQLERVVAGDPRRGDALYALAMAKKALGRTSEVVALLQRCLRLNASNPIIFAELGFCHLELREAVYAISAFRKALSMKPNEPEWLRGLGLAFALHDQVAESRDAFRRALALDPTRVETIVHLVQQLVRLTEYDDAILVLEAGLKRMPENPTLLSLLGSAVSRQGDAPRAEELYRRAIAVDPTAVHSYGVWLQEQGRFEDSIACLAESVRVQPHQGLAYYRLTEAKAFSLDGAPLLPKVQAVEAEGGLSGEEAMYLHYALGKLHEHDKNYADSMKHYDAANHAAFTLYNTGRPYDPDDEARTTARRMEVFSRERLAEGREQASTSDCPILIVGMIRSGTTLLDQILSSHPEVAAAGELNFWMVEADRLVRADTRRLEDPQLRQLAASYLDQLRQAAGESARITDKMPLNYAYLGLIHTVFPHAKILHMRRNPLDTCLSIYSTHFGLGPRWAYRQENIVANYREYQRLMEHWRHALPAEMFLDVDYEGLIGDREGVMRRVLEFCGLPWDDRCLHHEANAVSIRTPSRWQARQPIYRSSIERWKPFEPYLGCLRELRPQ